MIGIKLDSEDKNLTVYTVQKKLSEALFGYLVHINSKCGFLGILINMSWHGNNIHTDIGYTAIKN